MNNTKFNLRKRQLENRMPGLKRIKQEAILDADAMDMADDVETMGGAQYGPINWPTSYGDIARYKTKKGRERWPMGGHSYPMKDWGRTYSAPSAQSLAKYGKQWNVASLDQRAARASDKYYGRGLYSGRGGYLGTALGAAAKWGCKKYLGRGTYTSNSLVNSGSQRPSMSAVGGGDNQSMIITHKEYLQDVYGPVDSTFTNESVAINPGLAQNFPWLAQIAANYEEYEFIQVVYEFHSTITASQSTTGATGTLIMATQYNPDAVNFASKEVMMQYHGASSGRVTDEQVHGVECDPSKNAGPAIRFVRSNVPADSQSLKDFDLGKFQFALVNLPAVFANQQVGEMWVHYKVKLSKPRLFSSVYRALPYQTWCPLATGNNAFGPIVGYSTSLYDYARSPSTLGIVLDHETIIPGSTAVVFTFTFPNFMTGSFDVCTFCQYMLGGGTNDLVTKIGVSGNVTLIVDMAGVNANAGAPAPDPQDLSSSCTTMIQYRNGWQSRIHVDVQPATAAVDNKLTIQFDFGGFAANTVTDTAFASVTPYNKVNFGKLENSLTGLALN